MLRKLLTGFVVVATSVALAWAATYTGNTIGDLVVTTPDGSIEPVSVLDDAIKEIKRAVVSALPTRSYLAGYGISNNASDATNDIDIAVGSAMDSTNVRMLKLASALTKQLDAAWAVGTNAGCRDTGSIANNTWHIHAIMRVDTNVVDILCSLSVGAPTMPTNYTLFRRIGSIIRSGATILAFDQDGNYVRLDATVLDTDATNPGASAVTRTLTVPTGINVIAFGSVYLENGAAAVNLILLSDLASSDEAPATASGRGHASTQTAAGTQGIGTFAVRTNTSAQIRSRQTGSNASDVNRISTWGWIDTRGRDN